MFTVDLSFLKGIHWGCVVADDAHRLRGINSKIRAGFRDLSAWCRVIIPRMPILDNLNEMWSMLNLTNHNNFDSFDKFASLYKEKGDSILESHLLHRTSSIDTCTIPMHSDFVLEVELTDTQKVLYSSILKTCQEQLFIQSKEVATKIVHGITDLLGCCNHPLVVAHSDDCVNDNKGVEKSGKMNLLGKLLEMLYAEGKHRAVVCTRSTRTLDIMEQLVLSRGQPYERIDISMHRDNREQAAARFRKSPATITTVALLCLAPDSFTVDLCTANILIMYDSEWDNQYTEACLRCCWAGCEGTESHSGEERKIAVFRLVTRDTCEAYLHNYAMGDAEIPEAAGLGRVQCDIKTMNKQSLNTLLRYSTFAILEGAQKTDLKKDVFELPPAGNRKLILTTRALRCIKEEAEPTTVDVNDTDFWEKIFHRATESAEPQQNTTKSTKKRDESSSNSSSISDEGDESYAEDEEEEEGYGEGEYNDLENSDPCTTKSTDTSKKRGARCKKEWTRTKRDKLRTIISGHGWECPEQAQVITNENQTKESVQSQARALLACYLNNVKREHAIYFAREITGVNLTARGLAAEPCIQSWMLIPDPMYQMAIKLPVAERDAAADDELTYKEPSFLAYLKANSEAQLKQILFVTRIQKLAANNFVGFVPCNKPFVPGWTTEDDKQLVCACVRWGINRFNKKMFNSSIKLSVTFAKRNSADSKKHAAMAAPSKKEFIRRLKRIVRTNFGSQLNKQSHKNSSQVSSATMPKSSKELPSFPFSLSDIKPGIESDCDDDDDDDDSGPGKDIGAEACCPDPSKVPGFKSLCSIANIEKGFYARCVSCLDEAIPITPRVPIPNVVSITGKPKAHTRSQEFNNLCSISLNDPLKMGIAGILSNEAPLITTTSTVLKQSSTQRLQQLPRTDNGLNMLQQGPVSNTAISQLYPNLQYLGTPPTESKHKHKHRHHHHHLYNSNVAQNANTGMCQPLPQALSASVAQEIRPLTETLDLVPPQKLASGGDQLLYNSSPTSYYVQFKRAQPQGAQLQQQQMITQSLCAQGWQQQQQQQQSGTIHFSSHPKRHISSSIADKLNDHERFVLVNTIMDQGIPRIGDLLNWEELKNRCKFCDKTATSVKRAFKDIIKTGAVVSGSKDKTIVSKLIKAFDFFMMIDTYIRKFKEMILLTSKHWVPCKTFPEWWTCAADVELIVGLAKFGLTNVWRGMTSFSPSYFYAKYREIGERLSAKLGRVASNIEVINAMNLPNKEEVTQRVMQIMEWCNIIQPNSQQQYQPQSQSQRATVPFATNIAQQQQQQQPMSIPQQPAPPLQFTANAYNGQAQEQIHFQSRMPQPPPPQMQTQEQAQPPPVSQDVANLSKLTFSQDNVGNIIYETPIKINDNLTVMSLGIIDLSPGFHNENYIYPCGYSVIRDIRNPRCMSDKVPCHCIVYRGDDGPMFRVNCSQGTYEGKTPTIAWGLLLMGYGYKKEEIYPRFGEALFGFDSSLVTYIIQALPGAKRCTRYKFRVVPTQGSPMPRGNRNSRLCFRV